MAETLYRKYRPQIFSDIQGQEGLTKALTNQIIRGTVAHAYLLSGTRGTGKTSTARIFAKALNCHTRQAGTAEPCGTCSSCQDISVGHSVDVIELDAATHTGVDVVREHIIENARFMPTRDKYKIFIIDEVHMLSTSSFNALLKSLEEPPAHIVYILATTELHKIPATITSRCQRFIFRPLPITVMEEKLRMIAKTEAVEISTDVLRRILAVSGGAMRDAESLLGQLISLGQGTMVSDTDADSLLPPTLFGEALHCIAAAQRGDRSAALSIIQNLFETGSDLPSFHESLIKRAHELLVVHMTKQIPAYLGIFSQTESELLMKEAHNSTAPWLTTFIEALLEKKPLYKTISSAIIPLHLVIAGMPGEKMNTPTPPHTQNTPAILPAPPKITPPQPNISPVTQIPAAPPEQAPPPTPSPAFLGAVQDNWAEILQDIKAELPSIAMILSSTTIRQTRENEVELVVLFPLHKERLSDIKIKSKIENCISNRCNTTITCKITVTAQETASDAAVEQLLESFGGRIVA